MRPRAPQCLSTEVCAAPSHALHVHLLQEELSQRSVSQMFCRSFPHPYLLLRKPDLTALLEGFLCCLIPGQREELLHFRGGDRPRNQPGRPAAFLVLKVLPGRGNTIQSVTGGVFFTGGWKEKGVKRKPRTPCVRGVGYPSLVSLGTCRASLHCSSVPNHCVLQGQPAVG